MQNGLQLVWPKSVASVEFDVAAFLSGELRHHRESNDRALTSSLLPSWLRETYEIFGRWAASGESEADHAQLDRIKAEFDAASRAFGRLVSAERAGSIRYRERADELQQAVSSLQEQGAASKKSFEALEAERSALQEQAAALEKQLEEQAAASSIESEALKSELQRAVEAEREALQTQMTNAATAFDEERQALEAKVAETAAEAEQRIGEITKSLQEERRRKTLMDAELHQLQEAREALEAKLAASQARRKEAARVIDRLKSDLEARYQELAALERQILRQSPSWWAAQSVRRVKRIFKAPGRKAYS
jgi:chromosome segregation ATPase